MMRRWERIVRHIWYPDAAERQCGWSMNGKSGDEFDDFVRAQAQMHTATRTPCSCYRCGNPRRHWGTPTVQELRANSNPQVELEGYGLD
jgi:hypothetical protein